LYPRLRRAAKRPSREGVSRGPGNEPPHALLFEPPSPRRRAHHGSRPHGRREIVSAEFSRQQPPEVRSLDVYLRSGRKLRESDRTVWRELHKGWNRSEERRVGKGR